MTISHPALVAGLEEARSIATSWRAADYYEIAEDKGQLDYFWRPASPFMRGLAQMDLSHALELSAGHGRHAARLLATPAFAERITSLVVMDVNDNLIARCKERITDPRASFLVNDGSTFAGVADGALTGIYCFDSMVHFELVTVMTYLADCARVLRRGGKALFHHSNFDRMPGAAWHATPHSRNFMTARLFQHLAVRAGLTVCWTSVIDWSDTRDLDAVTLVELR